MEMIPREWNHYRWYSVQCIRSHLCLIGESTAATRVITRTQVNDAESMSRGGVVHKVSCLPVWSTSHSEVPLGVDKREPGEKMQSDTNNKIKMCGTINLIYICSYAYLYRHTILYVCIQIAHMSALWVLDIHCQLFTAISGVVCFCCLHFQWQVTAEPLQTSPMDSAPQL